MVAWSARQGDWMFNVYIIIFLYFVCNKVTGLGLHLKFGPMGVSGNKKKDKIWRIGHVSVQIHVP